MINNHLVHYYVTHEKRLTVYIGPHELTDLLNNLKPSEIHLYNLLKSSFYKANKGAITPDYFRNASLAQELGISEGSLRNLKSALIKKNYLRLEFFKDARSTQQVKVVLGRECVTLYDMGLDVSIADSKAWEALRATFPLDDPKLSPEERTALLKEANEFYRDNWESK